MPTATSYQGLEFVRLPASLRRLEFGDEFNQDLRSVTFPEDLEEIIFGENFRPASWEHVTLPSNLLSLKFGKRFIQNLEDAKLPESLSSLSFASLGYAFEQSLKRARLPKHIQRLQTGSILVSVWLLRLKCRKLFKQRKTQMFLQFQWVLQPQQLAPWAEQPTSTLKAVIQACTPDKKKL